MRPKPRRACAFVFGAAFLSGCHNYIPVERPEIGSTVRVRVPVTSAVADPNSLRESSASIEGEVVASGDSIALAVLRRMEYGAYREVVRQDTFRVAAADAIAIERREYSRNKSVALGVGIALAAAGLAATAFGIGGGQQGGGPNGGDPTQGPVIRIPLLGMAFGR